MLETLIEGILGKASFPGEVCAATIPAPPCDFDADVHFHRIVVERCLARLGYDVKTLNEALGVVFHENPTVVVDGETTPFTGVGISFGAGLTNLVVAWRAKKLFEMSVGRGGDWIDEKVAGVRGLSKSKVIAIKEKKLSLAKIDPKDPIQLALEIYHDDLIRYVLEHLTAQFRTTSMTIDEPLEWCVAGGTAAIAGFIEHFESALRASPLPFPLKGVRLAKDPLHAPAAGALVAALSHEKRKLAKLGEGPKPTPRPLAAAGPEAEALLARLAFAPTAPPIPGMPGGAARGPEADVLLGRDAFAPAAPPVRGTPGAPGGAGAPRGAGGPGGREPK
jgi:hypothetical protein